MCVWCRHVSSAPIAKYRLDTTPVADCASPEKAGQAPDGFMSVGSQPTAIRVSNRRVFLAPPLPRDHGKHLQLTEKKSLSTLDLGSHITHEHAPRVSARRLHPVILIEAPSSTYRRGMLALGKQLNHLRRRRPQAILHQAMPVFWGHRFARRDDVCLYPRQARRDEAPSLHASQPGDVAQGHGALS
jgi:hypothetical protein